MDAQSLLTQSVTARDVFAQTHALESLRTTVARVKEIVNLCTDKVECDDKGDPWTYDPGDLCTWYARELDDLNARFQAGLHQCGITFPVATDDRLAKYEHARVWQFLQLARDGYDRLETAWGWSDAIRVVEWAVEDRMAMNRKLGVLLSGSESAKQDSQPLADETPPERIVDSNPAAGLLAVANSLKLKGNQMELVKKIVEQRGRVKLELTDEIKNALAEIRRKLSGHRPRWKIRQFDGMLIAVEIPDSPA